MKAVALFFYSHATGVSHYDSMSHSFICLLSKNKDRRGKMLNGDDNQSLSLIGRLKCIANGG